MFNFSKADDKFVACATNDAERRVGIIAMSEQRKLKFWLAIIMSIVALIFISIAAFDGSSRVHDGVMGTLFMFNAVMQWISVMRTESDLRLLKVIDRLRQQDAIQIPQAQVPNTLSATFDSAEGSSAPAEPAP